MWFDRFLDKKIFIILGSLSVFIIIVCFFIFTRDTKEFQLDTISTTTLVSNEVSEDMLGSDELYVDVKGAVKIPGMYQVSQGMRVIDAIELAGGFIEDADNNQINFSERLVDQMVVYVPLIGEELPKEVIVSHHRDSGEDRSEGLININSASVSDLQQLSGIGIKKAEKIIQYREENGSFTSVEDLKKVDGIGEKTFDSLKSQITI